MYYAKEATNSIPHDIERFNSYVDSTMMAGYAQDVLSDAWDKAGFKFK